MKTISGVGVEVTESESRPGVAGEVGGEVGELMLVVGVVEVWSREKKSATGEVRVDENVSEKPHRLSQIRKTNCGQPETAEA